MRRFTFLLLLAAASATNTTTISVNSSHYYVEFPRDPAVAFTVGSLGCRSRIGLRHLTYSECNTVRLSGDLDAISGMAFPGGPWTTTETTPSFYTLSNDVSRQASCTTSSKDTDSWRVYFNELTTGTTVDRSQLDKRKLQICFSEDAIPLSEMHRQPAATANSSFILGDERMQCPPSSEPVLNAEDCITHVAQPPQFVVNMARQLSGPGQPDGCLHYSTHRPAGSNDGMRSPANIWYNAWHQHTATQANISSFVSLDDQNDFRVICRILEEPSHSASNSAGTTSVNVFVGFLALVVHAAHTLRD